MQQQGSGPGRGRSPVEWDEIPSVRGEKSLAREGGHVITLSDHIVGLKIYTIFEGEPVVPQPGGYDG